MPSAHAASMVALTLSVLITTGLSTVFYLATILMIIVIHDAVRSRYLVGLHSKILNKQLKGRKLEENVGHTLWEVFWGVVIGIGIVIVVFALI
jgi:acid phosphatase family membrane protein YuiD